MMAADVVALPSCLILAVWLTAPADPILMDLLLPGAIALAASVSCMRFSGFYRSVIRFMGLELLVAAFKCVTGASGILLAFSFLSSTSVLSPRHVGAFWFVALAYIVGSRTIARLLLQSGSTPGDRVLIYGAGEAGVRLASALYGRGEYSVVAFVDDNPTLHGSVINGYPIHSSSQIETLVEEFSIERVLLALPSVTRRQRRRIINRLEQLPVHVQTMPDLHDLILGQARVDDIREVDIEDLLGRDVVAPMPALLGPHIENRSVMVTGAGGSIGSELSRQILRLSPKYLILLEISEPALYEIDQRLREICLQNNLETEIVPLIGSVHHRNRVTEVLKNYSVDTIYHAAAYKHVPLVEHNMLEGVHNNIFGTLHTAEAAIDAGVKSFVLVSTDKAVKPTNVMGATKRYAELVLQALAKRESTTRFAIVRFGNVLASSGSVVPRFREQIRAGGPVTVTHPEIYRYFMTIPEAASLVLQAGSMAKGGEVFVLDMGEPVRIADLAEKMIHLMGLSVRDEENPDGDIEIEFTGLRPAEKLYEELLIGNDVSGTKHPRILQAQEHLLSWGELKPMLDGLWKACERQDCDAARELLLEGVTGYDPTDKVEDLVWRQRLRRAAGEGTVRPANVTRLEPRRDPGT
jgi:FlaA1/EpsC-like NDP-sugar epimerase